MHSILFCHILALLCINTVQGYHILVITFLKFIISVTYQFIKELLPAEWFPSSKMVIFFLGASRFNPIPLAMVTRPKHSTVFINQVTRNIKITRDSYRVFSCAAILKFHVNVRMNNFINTLPLSFSVYKSWHSFKIFSFKVTVEASGAFADVLCRPDGILNER